MERFGSDFFQIGGSKAEGLISGWRAPCDTSNRPSESEGARRPDSRSSTGSTSTTMNASETSGSFVRRRIGRRWLWNPNYTSQVGFKNTRQCYVKQNPLVALRWNATTQRYQVVPNQPFPSSNTTKQNSTSTRLLGRFRLERRDEEQTHPAIGDNETQGGVVYGRECKCVYDLLPSSRPYYCPDFVPVCQVVLAERPTRGGSFEAPVVTVTCTNITSTLYAKYLFPLALFFLIIYVFLCLCSPKGLAARMYGTKRVCRRWREDDERFEAGLHDELEWMLQRQRNRHEMVTAQRRLQEQRQRSQWPPPSGPNEGDGGSRVSGAALPPLSPHAQQQQRNLERVLIAGSTPFSALLLEVSTRQQQRQRETELVPVGGSGGGTTPEQLRPPAGATAQGSQMPPLASASSTTVLLKTRSYDGGAASTATTDDGGATDDENIATSADASGGGENNNNTADDSGRGGRGDGCTCSICLTDLAVGDRVGDLPCKHWFHTGCLKDWIKRRHRRCPLCMAAIPLVPKPQEPILPQEQPETALVSTVEPSSSHVPSVAASSII